jgi:hypothetical protein
LEEAAVNRILEVPLTTTESDLEWHVHLRLEKYRVNFRVRPCNCS